MMVLRSTGRKKRAIQGNAMQMGGVLKLAW